MKYKRPIHISGKPKTGQNAQVVRPFHLSRQPGTVSWVPHPPPSIGTLQHLVRACINRLKKQQQKQEQENYGSLPMIWIVSHGVKPFLRLKPLLHSRSLPPCWQAVQVPKHPTVSKLNKKWE